MKKICTLVLGVFLFHVSSAQLSFFIDNESANNGETVSIDVRVSDFTNIENFQFSINWNPAVLQYSTLTNISTTLPQWSASSFGTPDQPSIDPGQIAALWSLSSTEPFTINEQNHLLFTIECTVLGDPCDETIVNMTDEPRDIEFIDGDGNPVVPTVNDGSVEVPGTNCAGNGDGEIDFCIASDNVMSGQNGVCLEVTVNDFVNMSLIQVPVVWDPACITNIEVENQALSGGVSIINNSNGTLRYLWQDASLENPVTLPENSILFEFCFDVIADSGVSCNISIEDILNIPPNFPVTLVDNDAEELPHTAKVGTIIVQGGSTDVTFYYEDIEVELGTEACIPVKVRNFDNIQTFQFAMDFLESEMNFVSGANYNADLPIDDGALSLIPPGNLRVSWFDLGGFGIDLDDDVVIFEACFDIVGECDQTAALDFTGNPNGIEVTDSDNNILPFVFTAGQVTIICPCTVDLVANGQENVSCNGLSDGSLSVIADGGNGNYTYSWSNDDSGPMIDGLPAGPVTVTVTDGANCNTTATFVITEPEVITFSAIVIDETDDCDGSIDADFDGGTEPYSYTWSDPGTINSPLRENLCKGVYEVTVLDDNDCEFVTSFTIDPKALQVVDFTLTNVSCNGGSDGSIVVEVEGGCPDYTFAWSTGNDGTGLPAGMHTVTITDNSTPPVSITQTYPIAQPDLIVITVESIVASDETNNGSIDVSVVGGIEDYTYLWTPGNLATQDIANLSPGKYSLQVTDMNDCTMTIENVCVGSSFIKVEFEDSNSDTGPNNGFGVACNGDCTGVIDASVIAANGAVIFRVNDVVTTLPATGLCAGVYQIDFEDENGLMGDTIISILEPDALLANVTEQSDCSTENDGTATIGLSGGVEDYMYEWSGTNQTSASVDDLEAGDISVVVTDANGCQFMVEFEMPVCPPDGTCYEGTPVITPNEDGANDLFVISCLENENNILYIFDRFGRKVYQQSNYDNTWGGLNQQGAELQENGYMWVLELIALDGSQIIHKGTVTVLRSTY